MTQETKKPPRRFKLETKQDVIHYLSETVRSLRRLKVSDKEIDPIRINKQKTLVYALSKLAEVMRDDGLASLTDEQLSSEILRRERVRELAASRSAGQADAPATEAH